MIPIYQTIYGRKEATRPGNCLQACVASILELPLDRVPHFVEESQKHKEFWYNILRSFLMDKGYCLEYGDKPAYGQYNITVGKKYLDARYYCHAVVAYGGTQIHNPLPNDNHKLNQIWYYLNFKKRDSY